MATSRQRRNRWFLGLLGVLTLALNVLVNGSPEKPAVWVFEPQRHEDGVMSCSISTNDDIEQIISAIQNRLKAPPPIRTA